MTSILALDPGEKTGWCLRKADGTLMYGTCEKNHQVVAKLIQDVKPEIVVYESFHLYPKLAKTLSWSSFYTCEVVGVIRYVCMEDNIRCVAQAPSVKKYSGVQQAEIETMIQKAVGVTEHTKDAYMHLRYYERNNK